MKKTKEMLELELESAKRTIEKTEDELEDAFGKDEETRKLIGKHLGIYLVAPVDNVYDGFIRAHKGPTSTIPEWGDIFVAIGRLVERSNNLEVIERVERVEESLHNLQDQLADVIGEDHD